MPNAGPSPDAPFVAAVLLAAGESMRMGTQKALLRWAGVTLLDYQLAQLAGVDDIREIIVVTGHEPAMINQIVVAHGARAVHNASYRSGKVSSIITGLNAISHRADAILLVAVDQPRPGAVVRSLTDRYAERRAPITVPAHAGRRGHPLLFARALLPELLAIREESLGVRAVLERHRQETAEVEVRDPIIHLDLNAPADLPKDPPSRRP